MSEPRFGGPLDDSSLDREVERLLAVEPSPEFAVGVRRRVAVEPAWRNAVWQFRWALMVSGAVAAAVVVAVVFPTLNSTVGPSGHTEVQRLEESATPASGDADIARRELPAQAIPPGSETDTKAATDSEPSSPDLDPSHSRTPVPSNRFPEVLVSEVETDGFGLLLERLREGEFAVAVTDEPSDPAEDRKPAEIVIAPIEFDPIETSELTKGAVE